LLTENRSAGILGYTASVALWYVKRRDRLPEAGWGKEEKARGCTPGLRTRGRR
jgi:hypothetical protein